MDWRKALDIIFHLWPHEWVDGPARVEALGLRNPVAVRHAWAMANTHAKGLETESERDGGLGGGATRA